MPDLYVCEGATCTCTSGTTPAALIVTSQELLLIDELLAATTMDYLPITNLASFGTCAVLTAAASGVSTPCVPVTAAPWTPGSILHMANGLPLLTSESMLTCSVGGVITITLPNNILAEGE